MSPRTASPTARERLSPALLEPFLARLGLPPAVPVSGEGLSEVYAAWCRAVPFDNALRRIQLAQGERAALPGSNPDDFVRDYLAHGVGGPCAPASAALAALLRALGFETRTLLAAIGEEGELRPDHATVAVRLGGEELLLDTVVLCERPIPLLAAGRRTLPDPLHPVAVERWGDGWRVDYVAAMTRQDEGCTVLDREIEPAARLALYEETQCSPTFRRFNSALYVRRNLAGAVSVLYRAWHVRVDRHGRRERQLDVSERRRLLVREFGFSPAIVARLPEDEP
ncbi:MAG: arylamine N-acetyltransferase [Solirubrobacterales bacterium]